MEQVFANTLKVLVDTEGSGNMMYLLLDKIMQRQNSVNLPVQVNTPQGNLGTTQSRSTPIQQSRTGRSDRFGNGGN
jgi:membrane protease subunit HflK